MAAATAGRVRNVHTLAEAYCNLIMACASVGDWERATEWCELVDSFARRHETAPLFGACRTVHADVLVANGRWAEAENALQIALETHARYIPQMSAPAVASLAELRVQQGRLPEAEDLLAGREEHPGRAASARAAADRRRPAPPGRGAARAGLRGTEDSPVAAAQLLAPLVDARLALGDVAGARSAAEDLAALAGARTSGCWPPGPTWPRPTSRSATIGSRTQPSCPPCARRLRSAAHAPGGRDSSPRPRAGGRLRGAGHGPRRGARRADRLPRAGGVAGDGRRRRRAARAG